MLELIVVILCVVLFFKAIGLVLKLAGGVLKVIVSLVSFLLVPALVVGAILVGGLMLLAPIVVLALVICVCKSAAD